MLITGILFAILTGFLRGAMGVVVSHVARKKMDFTGFITGAQIIIVALSWIFIPRYSALSFNLPHLNDLILVLIASGFFLGAGMYAVNKAMRSGHHGSTWTFSQSALVIPFLLGVFIWKDEATGLNIAGVSAVLVGIYFIGQDGMPGKIQLDSASHC